MATQSILSSARIYQSPCGNVALGFSENPYDVESLMGSTCYWFTSCEEAMNYFIVKILEWRTDSVLGKRLASKMSSSVTTDGMLFMYFA